MFIKLFLITIVIMAIAFLGLGVQTFFSKKKKFPETKIGHNKQMRKNKIFCYKTQQKIIDKGLDGNGSCSSC